MLDQELANNRVIVEMVTCCQASHSVTYNSGSPVPVFLIERFYPRVHFMIKISKGQFQARIEFSFPSESAGYKPKFGINET